MGRIIKNVAVIDQNSHQSRDLLAEFDSGGAKSLIKEESADFCDREENDFEMTFHGIGDGEVRSRFHCHLSFKVGGRLISEEVFIVPSTMKHDGLSQVKRPDVIIGATALQQGDIVLYPRRQMVGTSSDMQQMMQGE